MRECQCQIGNAFPPPVAAAVARQIFAALSVKHVFKVAQLSTPD